MDDPILCRPCERECSAFCIGLYEYLKAARERLSGHYLVINETGGRARYPTKP